MYSDDASSENSELKIELRVGEEKLQLALPTKGRTWPASGIGGIAPRADRTRPAPNLGGMLEVVGWWTVKPKCPRIMKSLNHGCRHTRCVRIPEVYATVSAPLSLAL